MLAPDKCDMRCAGTMSGEYCGGRYAMTAYEIQHQVPVAPNYIGCFEDGLERAMNEAGKHVTRDMTNEVSFSNGA